MSQIPENDPFHEIISAESQRLTGNFPGMPELIEELNYQELGRPIVLQPSSKPQGLLSTILLGASAEPKVEQTQIGTALPLNPQQTEHLVLFSNGHMYAIEAIHETDGRIYQGYMDNFGASSAPLVILGDTLASVEHHLVENAYSYGFERNALKANTNPEHVGQIHVAREKALAMCQEVKQQRDRAIAETARQLIDDFNALLNPKPKSPDPEV